MIKQTFSAVVQTYYQKVVGVEISNIIMKKLRKAADKIAKQILNEYDLDNLILKQELTKDDKLILTIIVGKK